MTPRLLSVVVSLCCALAPSPSRAESDADAYCTFAGSVATSQSALLYSPQLYVAVGYINGDDGVTGAVTAASSRTRLTVGLRYSMSELYQGAMNSARAKSDCARYRVTSQLNAFLESTRELESQAALAAKIGALEADLPHAAEIMAAARLAARDGRSTVEQLNATQLRVDALEASLAEARQARAVAAQRPAPPTTSIAFLQRSRDAEERAFEGYEGRLRRTQAWDVVLRGGYDRLFGVRDQVPLFGIALVSFNPGWFAQHRADHRAQAARTRWSHLDPAGTDQRVLAVLRQFAVIEQAERGRFVQASALLADLEARWHAVAGLEGPHVQVFRDYLWFDLVRLRAEAAYLKAHLAELERYRGDRS